MKHEQDPTHAPAPELPDDFHLPEERTLLKATGIAAAVAAVLLLLVILPAEYGVDLTGFGRLTGIDGIAAPDASSGIYTAEDSMYRNDTLQFTIEPGNGLEHKFDFDAGSGMVYSWRSTGDVYYDFHGDPRGGDGSDFTSFETGTADRADGSFTAPFDGIHGWWWKNNGSEPVVVTLRTSGHYAPNPKA